MLIGDVIAQRAALHPDRVYWEQEAARVTYGQMEHAANRVARALRAGGPGAPLAPGDHVAICGETDWAYAAVHFGAAKAGLVLVHLNPGLPAGELARLIAHSDARLLLAGARAKRALAGLGQAGAMLPPVVTLPGSDEEAEAEKEGDPAAAPWRVTPWEEWLAPHGGEPPPAPSIGPGTPFQMLYTSGTTGAPKGVLIPHRAKLRQGMTHRMNLALEPGHRVLSALPLHHQYAQWLLLVTVPLAGATAVVHARFDAAAAWSALAGGDITHLPLVPTTLYRLLEFAQANPGSAKAPALHCIVYGGAAVDATRLPQVRRVFPGARLFQGFGQTETGYCMGLHDAHHESHPHSLGLADVFSEVRLRTPDGAEAAIGEVGEIVARTPYLMLGYYKNPGATAEYFAHGEGWGRTGDLARRDAEGFFTLVGRVDDMLISGGVNVHPEAVEQALAAHPAVRECAVVGAPHPEWGQQVAAVVCTVGGRELDAALVAELEAHCRERLAPHQCPRQWRQAAELPRTHSGKVRRFVLARHFAGEHADAESEQSATDDSAG